MVQFLSINFFSWISSTFVGFFKSSFFLCVCRPVQSSYSFKYASYGKRLKKDVDFHWTTFYATFKCLQNVLRFTRSTKLQRTVGATMRPVGLASCGQLIPNSIGVRK